MSRALLLAHCSTRVIGRVSIGGAVCSRRPQHPPPQPRRNMAATSASSSPAAGGPPQNAADDNKLAEAKRRARDAFKARLRALPREEMDAESAAVAGHVAASSLFRRAESVGLYATCARLREVDTWPLIDAALAQGKRVHLPLVLDRQSRMALLHVPLGRRDLRAGAPPFGIAEPRSRNYLVAAARGGGADDEDEELAEGPEPRANALPEEEADEEQEAAAEAAAAAERGPRRPPRRLDLLLVPGLAFDREGRRLGRGGGYYDRAIAALRRLRPDDPPLLVALAFRAQVVGEGGEGGEGAAPPLPPPLPADDATDARVDVLATPDGLVACSARGRAALEEA
jgi:5-formyltetrahydrofolate cyclo-ligase